MSDRRTNHIGPHWRYVKIRRLLPAGPEDFAMVHRDHPGVVYPVTNIRITYYYQANLFLWQFKDPRTGATREKYLVPIPHTYDPLEREEVVPEEEELAWVQDAHDYLLTRLDCIFKRPPHLDSFTLDEFRASEALMVFSRRR